MLEPEHIVAIPVASDFTSFVNQFTLPDFSAISNMQVYTVALTLAIVASIESLLCAEATDKLDPYKRTTNLNTELKAQGVGNLISGLIGGLPVTQVIVRSSTNIQSGGKTRAAAFFPWSSAATLCRIDPQYPQSDSTGKFGGYSVYGRL